MAFKEGVEEIIGRRIKGVVIKRSKVRQGRPAGQLFLLFDDGTYYEFYTDSGEFTTTSGVFGGSLGSVLQYMGDMNKPVYVKYQE